MADNSYTADRRLYLNKDGKVVEADDPTRTTLLVGKNGRLSAEDAAKYGLMNQPAPEEKAQSDAPANKAVGKAPSNKAQSKAPEATPAAKEKAEEEGIDLSEVEGTGAGGRITLADVEKATGE